MHGDNKWNTRWSSVYEATEHHAIFLSHDVIAKYKKSQLPFFDELRVFDPRQRDSMPQDLQSYPNLLSPELQQLLHTSHEW